MRGHGRRKGSPPHRVRASLTCHVAPREVRRGGHATWRQGRSGEEGMPRGAVWVARRCALSNEISINGNIGQPHGLKMWRQWNPLRCWDDLHRAATAAVGACHGKEVVWQRWVCGGWGPGVMLTCSTPSARARRSTSETRRSVRSPCSEPLSSKRAHAVSTTWEGRSWLRVRRAWKVGELARYEEIAPGRGAAGYA